MKNYNNFIENGDIIITLPSSIRWEDYMKEVVDAKKNNYVLNFKVGSFPKKTKIGNKCYILHNNQVKGWMKIIGFDKKNFICKTTGKRWTGKRWTGKFIIREPIFNPINPIQMKSFQGFRYFKPT